jgi:hypothetical protein
MRGDPAMRDTATQPELDIHAGRDRDRASDAGDIIAVPPTKRAAIESELRNDAGRSDRRRREMGIAPPLGNSPPPNPDAFRGMLVKGIEDFDAKYPQESAGECVDRMISEGKISYATAGSGGQGSGGKDDNALANDEGVTVLCAEQSKITIEFDEEGNAILRQSEWPDDDAVILIRRDNIDTFIDKLTDALGIPTFGRP